MNQVIESYIPRVSETVSSFSNAEHKDSERDAIQSDVEAFLAAGGEIQQHEIRRADYKQRTRQEVIDGFKKYNDNFINRSSK